MGNKRFDLVTGVINSVHKCSREQYQVSELLFCVCGIPEQKSREIYLELQDRGRTYVNINCIQMYVADYYIKTYKKEEDEYYTKTIDKLRKECDEYMFLKEREIKLAKVYEDQAHHHEYERDCSEAIYDLCKEEKKQHFLEKSATAKDLLDYYNKKAEHHHKKAVFYEEKAYDAGDKWEVVRKQKRETLVVPTEEHIEMATKKIREMPVNCTMTGMHHYN